MDIKRTNIIVIFKKTQKKSPFLFQKQGFLVNMLK